ncbi:hypothetical protein AVEN_127540-1 [Araneus ventricosus]|uniref:Uncharacterized protein n=1 Tax=Araneus ventricosus TaxID=182803 RepID=A0A4Y2HRI9_ARAVE|nr:hypothetical protein AVEN_127540-1 [Araneus ventricosus]
MPVVRRVEIIRHYCPPTVDAKPIEFQTLLTGNRRILTSTVAGGRKELDERKRNEMRFGEVEELYAISSSLPSSLIRN